MPGDGIGPEVVEAARRVVEASEVDVEWLPMEAGLRALEQSGDALPPEVVETITSMAGKEMIQQDSQGCVRNMKLKRVMHGMNSYDS